MRRLKIYRIFNDFDNKVYVGQTVRSLEQRFKEHCNSDSSLHLHRAIQKHGKEHFFIEEVDSAQTHNELDKLEVEWIKKLDAVKNGYNMVYEAHGGSEKVRMRWERMTKEERQAANSYIKEINAKRWAEASEDDRKSTGAAMKAGWEGKDRRKVIKDHWDSLTIEQKQQRCEAMKAGWKRRLSK